jgi:hypothetical protein
MPAFRWPLRGRVTTNFGAKTVGGSSDGIDLAVPVGTAVRAADDGVVAYAGNELKGYGNLVLIRHANGFVTAYANASEINVKRNDQVHRGQVIAKSGQTGSAATPQLHFEIRKDSTPVDPMQYLVEEPLVKNRFQDISIPTALLRRAITSASNNKGAVEHTGLMNFLHAQNDTYNNQARISIDSALADRLSKKLDQRDRTEVRVYDLDDLRAGNIRSKINPPPIDAHFLFLTLRRVRQASWQRIGGASPSRGRA